MSSTMQILSALAIAGALLFLGAAPQPAQDSKPNRPRMMYFIAQYDSTDGRPPAMGRLVMASNGTGWNPEGRPIPSAREKAQNAKVRTKDTRFHVQAAKNLHEGFEWKFTRGSWETVEVGSDGRDIPNRKLTKEQIALANEMLDQGKIPEFRFRIEGFADQRPTRWPELAAPKSTVTGDLRNQVCGSSLFNNMRVLRVWLPPGYDAPENSDRRYPVLYMNDGQNLFDVLSSFAGEWAVDETATRLIEAGTIPPMIVVGIDNAGATRGDEYLPRDAGSRRPGTGGRADDYLRFVSEEVMRTINKHFRTLTGPEHTAFGGSSFGGVVTLHAAMTRPDLFGAILVESPSLWVEDGAFLQRVVECKAWPQRVYLAQGDREYGEEERSAELVEMTRKVEAAMREAGLGEDRLMVVIGEGDAHNEAAWAKRLPAAMEFLFANPAPSAEDHP